MIMIGLIAVIRAKQRYNEAKIREYKRALFEELKAQQTKYDPFVYYQRDDALDAARYAIRAQQVLQGE